MNITGQRTHPTAAPRAASAEARDAGDVPTLVDRRADSVPAGPRDRLTLTVLGGSLIGTVLRFSGRDVILGRGGVTAIPFEDPSISRRHARVFRADASVYIEDLGSACGTFVRGKRIDGPALLQDGDLIGVGPDRMLRYAVIDASEEGAARELYDATVRDPTTGAYNRRHFERRFAEEQAFAARHGGSLALLLLDVDDLKVINDTQGHHIGDLVLRLIAATIQRLLRPEDLLVRYGGDEFVVLCRGTTLRNGVILADRIRRCIEQLPLQANGRVVRITMSAGVASETAERVRGSLLADADRAMYRAKAEGRNKVSASGS